ncbi:MAG: hypothetical protein ACOC6E_03245 [Thermodesulfobacteriota bacterium]
MGVCDFIVLPSTDETQSGTLARIIALNKPYITIAPMEGLTAQTLESEGGLLFTTKHGFVISEGRRCSCVNIEERISSKGDDEQIPLEGMTIPVRTMQKLTEERLRPV